MKLWTVVAVNTLLCGAGLVALAGCGSGEEPASSAGGPVAASAPPAVPAAARPASAPASSAARSAPPAASSSPASAAAGDPPSVSGAAVKLTLAPQSSTAQIHMRELLAGNAIQNDAVESTKSVSGSLTIGPDGSVAPRSTISLDLRTLQSDRATRDRFIKGPQVLNTGSTPNAEVTVTELQGLSRPLPVSGQKTFKMVSDATVRGVTRPLTWTVTATFDGQSVKGQAAADFTLSEFGLNVPQVGPVIKVDDPGKLVVDFTAARSAA